MRVRSVAVVSVIRFAALAVLVAFCGVLLPASATAHGVSDTADVSLAQSFAGNELTVIIRRTATVPGPLRLDVIAHRPVHAVDLQVSLRGEHRVLPLRRPGMHATTMHVAAPGPHELLLQVGEQRALVPFRVLTPRTARWELVVYGGFAVAGLALAGALVAAGYRRRGPAITQAGLTVLALTAALTAAALSPTIPPPLPSGAAPTAGVDPAVGAAGRPYALAAVTTTPPGPVAGQDLKLRLRLVDGSTGRPVDDLVVHHGALAHTVVTSSDGRFFAHLHPVRSRAGELTVRLVPTRPGRYLVHTELERADSGTQLVSGEFTVGGDAVPSRLPDAVPSGSTYGVAAGIRTMPARLVAGRPSTIEVNTAADDLQPWLGMAGHLIIRDGSGRFFAHAHEMGSMSGMTGVAAQPGAARPDETVALYGPVLRFTFTFPAAGRYVAWVQYARDFEIHTVPLVFDVANAGGAP